MPWPWKKDGPPATLIQDAPLAERVGMGMHAYHNYSGQHYGAVTLRNALGNSLNIPAVRTIQFVGSGELSYPPPGTGVHHLESAS